VQTHYFLQSEASPFAVRKLVKAAMTIVKLCIDDQELLYYLDLALFEACANVARHAYSPGYTGDLQILLDLSHGKHLQIKVRDFGNNFKAIPENFVNPPPDAEQGRGLYIISQLVTHLSVSRENDATVVCMKHEIPEEKWIQSA